MRSKNEHESGGAPRRHLRFTALTDRGRIRPTNQDSFHAGEAPAGRQDTHGWLFVVADGMGGHRGGEIASQMAVMRSKRPLRRCSPMKATTSRPRKK